MIIQATKYASVSRLASQQAGRGQGTSRSGKLRGHVKARSGPAIRVKGPKGVTFEEWWSKEMKEGNILHKYFDRVRHSAPKRWRKVAQRASRRTQNNQSDHRVLAQVPLNDYLRWKQVDEHFWQDDNNLRKLRQDNPDLRECIRI
tara:strand:+ start:518 stop:952 length:435 start_codon:yes stop_codon:yes gene_type:complete